MAESLGLSSMTVIHCLHCTLVIPMYTTQPLLLIDIYIYIYSQFTVMGRQGMTVIFFELEFCFLPDLSDNRIEGATRVVLFYTQV